MSSPCGRLCWGECLRMSEALFKTLTNDAGDERVTIVRRKAGVFAYRREWHGEGSWSGALDLGLYDFADTAETEARMRIDGLVPAFHQALPVNRRSIAA